MGYEVTRHKGTEVVIVDLANTHPDETVAVLHEAQRQISLLPPKSARILTDVTNAVYNRASTSALMEYVQKNTPHVAYSAVVGIDGLMQVILQTLILVTGRQFRVCGSREEAMEWLVAQT